MADFNFKIKTEADLKALEETKKALEASRDATAALGRDTSVLENEIKKVDDALKSEAANAVRSAEGLKKAIDATKAAKGDASSLEEELRRLQKDFGVGNNPISKAADFLTDSASKLPGAETFKKLFNGSSAVVASAGLAFAAAAKGVDEYAEAQQRVAGLDAALAQNSLLTEAYREQLQELAGDLQTTTGVADDKWIGVLTRLTQFGSKPETIGMDVEAVKNLAGLLGGDIEQAAQAYSKALQGQYDMFSRMGLKIDETASQMEKLKQLQEQAAQRGGGQLEASNRTLIGQWQQLKNNTSDFFEAIGRWLAQSGVLQSALYGVGSTIAWVASQMGGAVPQLDGLKNSLQQVAPSADEAAKAIKSYGEQVKEDIALSKAYQDALGRDIDALRRKQRAIDELTSAEMARDLAAVDALEKQGKISQSDAIQQRADITAKAKRKQAENELDTNAQEIAKREAELQRREAEIAAAGEAVKQAEAAKAKIDNYNRANQKADKSGKDAAYWKGQLEGLDAYLDKGNPFATHKLPDFGLEFNKMTSGTSVFDKVYAARDKIVENIAKAEREQANQARRASVQNPVTAEDKAQASKLDKAKENRDEVTQANQGIINDLQSQVQNLKQANEQLRKRFGVDAPTEAFKAATERQEAQKKAVAEPFPTGVTVNDAVAQMQIYIATLNQRLGEELSKVAQGIQKTGEINIEGLRKIKQKQDEMDTLMKQQQQQLDAQQKRGSKS